MSKIYSLNNFCNYVLPKLKFFKKKLVFTNGCFDIVHVGHLDYLYKASNYGDILIIGINSDDSVKRLKGLDRPINRLESRVLFLSYFHFVDYIIPFEEDTPLQLIQAISPDVLVKGSDYAIHNIVGFDWVNSYNGLVATIDLVEGHSTSSIINKIKR
jgi:D-beta-D-heptose 7-phosphate kinase/D-beta-D-heptose 1-phosphate adenosyltransferase